MTDITPSHLGAWCGYCDERITLIFAGRPSLSPTEILSLDIPAVDRLWAVMRPEVLGVRALKLAACDMAERVLPLFEAQFPGDDRPRAAIETAKRSAVGEVTAEELYDAEDAADAAATAARLAAQYDAEYAAMAAAWAASSAPRAAPNAAWHAAMAVAKDAARGDISATARIAALDAAWAAEREAQLGIVRGYLESAGVSR